MSRRSFIATAGLLAAGLAAEVVGAAPLAFGQGAQGVVAPLRPAVTLDVNGKLTFVVNIDEGGPYYGLLHGWQTAPGTGPFLTTRLEQDNPFIASAPVTALDVSGKLTYFVTQKFSSLRHGWQIRPGTGPFESILLASLATLPAVRLDSSGRLVGIYAYGDVLKLIRQHTPGLGPWDFSDIPAPARPGRPAIGVDNTGRLVFFSRLEDGSLLYGVERYIGGPWETAVVTTGVSDEPAATLDRTGRLVFFARLNNVLVRGRQDQPGGTSFTLETAGKPVAGSPACSLDAGGKLTYFSRTVDGSLLHGWKDTPDGPWNTTTLATGLIADPGVGLDVRGKLTYFVPVTGGKLVHGWQDAPGAGPWHSVILL